MLMIRVEEGGRNRERRARGVLLECGGRAHDKHTNRLSLHCSIYNVFYKAIIFALFFHTSEHLATQL